MIEKILETESFFNTNKTDQKYPDNTKKNTCEQICQFRWNGQTPLNDPPYQNWLKKNEKSWISPNSIKEIEQKTPGSRGFITEYYEILKEILSILYKIFQKVEEGKHFSNHFMRPVLHHTQTWRRRYKERKPQTNILHEVTHTKLN